MKIISGIAVIMILSASTSLRAAEYCGELTYGADYTNSADRQKSLGIVEQFHFTPNVENLIHGNSASLGGEIDYTLMHFPNHHRALSAMASLALKEKTPRPKGAGYSVDCYFDRAIRFRPDDGVVHMVYGIYLSKLGKAEQAIEQLREAVRLQPENANINYNLGLLYLAEKDYEQAKTYAKKAYALGFSLPGLKNKLMRAGKWDDQP